MPCCQYSDPWPYPGPICTDGYPRVTCSTPTCSALTKSPYRHCLNPGSGAGVPLTGFEHLLKHYCSTFAFRKPGDICLKNEDCRPADQASAARLICNAMSSTCVSAARPPAPAGYGGSCGLTVSYLKIGASDQAYKGVSCAVCHVIGDAAAKCLKQGCTTPCKYDEDCPSGSVCVCAGGPYLTLSQVCAVASKRDKPSDRTAALKCYP